MSRTMENTPESRASGLVYLYNGTIRTMDVQTPESPHMLVCGDRIGFCSPDRAPLGLDFREAGFDAVRQRMGTDVRFVDLKGAAVIPGLVDSHAHFMWWALKRGIADLNAATSEESAVEMLRAHSAGGPQTGWLRGSRWMHNGWPGSKLPSRRSLDAAFPDRPVFLSSKCGHLAWVNSAALAAAGIDASTPDPDGGEIEREKHGVAGPPTGILKENAIQLVEQCIPQPTLSERFEALLAGQSEAHALGLTTVHSPEDLETWEFMQQADYAGHLTIRVDFMLPCECLQHASAVKQGLVGGANRLRVAGIKVFMDGSLGGRTAWMYEAFEGEPSNFGIRVTDTDQLGELVRGANALGLPAAVHAIGDRAVGSTLRAFETAQEEARARPRMAGAPLLRNRIEHLQLFAESDIELMRRVQPVASVQPIHLCADMDPADRFWGRRARYAYAFRTLLDLGCPLIFGTDAPVEPINPMYGLYAAVTRKNLEGQPDAGWYPQERVTVEEALRALTSAPAAAAGREAEVGTLSPGKLADFVVLNADPVRESPEAFPNMRPLATWVAGNCVYQSDEGK